MSKILHIFTGILSKMLRKTDGCSNLGLAIFSLFLALVLCQVSWAQGDNLWNIRENADDRFHDNTPWLRPWRSSVDDGVGRWVGQWSYEVPWGPVSTIGGSNGSLSISRTQDHQFHVWTYVHVATAQTISLYGAGDCVGSVFVNYAFDNRITFAGNYATLALNSGWNRIDITGYNQNSGYTFTCGALASLVDAMNSIGTITHAPISYWRFDEGSGTIAYDSVNGNHGTIYEATWTNGIVGSALYFDGVDDYVDILDSDILDIASNLTVECWIKTNADFWEYVEVIDNIDTRDGYGLMIDAGDLTPDHVPTSVRELSMFLILKFV